MSYIIYIGVDDTDIIGSVGTGKVARGLAARLIELGLGESLGVGRHQLLVDPRVKYTSHNSSKSLAMKTDSDIKEFYEPAAEFIKGISQPGSDPGLCIAAEKDVDEEIETWGKRAKIEVLTMKDAIDMASGHKVFLKGLGGDNGGVIGALASVGLRSWGNEGRLVDLAGINDVKGMITVAELLKATPIEAVQDASGKLIGKNEVIDSKDWMKPSLVGGRPILRVTPSTDSSGKRIWLNMEKRMKGDD